VHFIWKINVFHKQGGLGNQPLFLSGAKLLQVVLMLALVRRLPGCRLVLLAALFCACALPITAQQSPAASSNAIAEPAAPHGEVQYLWPEGAPDALGKEEQDKPHLEIFHAAPGGLHAAVIVCPGGGYTHLAYDKEGTRIAEWLNLRGISAFVLTYRLAPRYRAPAPILDGERAVRWVRAHAQQYAIDPARIGMWGFSAGGHLVGMVATHFDEGHAQSSDPVERVGDRPDFVISSYGGLTLQPGVAKPGAMGSLLGSQPAQELIDDNSPDKHVSAKTPPFFLYATTTDQAVPVLSSVVFYTALVRAGVPAEMHIFAQGPHGTALAQNYPALSAWTTLLENWLRLNGWLGSAAPVAGEVK
jgi:acetyl esterase/lipase